MERYGGMEFGLPHMADLMFDRYWREGAGTDIDVLAASVGGMPVNRVQAVLVDALRLTESDVPTWAIQALWSLCTEQRHVLRDEGWDGRDWLQQIVRTYRDHLLRVVPGGPFLAPPNPYVHLTGAVLDELLLVSRGMLEESLSPRRRYVPGIVPAIEQVALRACPDLAFRLLLRALSAFSPGVAQGQFDRYVELGRAFEYGELLVEGYDHLVE
jgi:hypothetical protein